MMKTFRKFERLNEDGIWKRTAMEFIEIGDIIRVHTVEGLQLGVYKATSDFYINGRQIPCFRGKAIQNEEMACLQHVNKL
jgi:hypothetical protein